ncbi:MAG: Mut7-C RNAse domain-containing protein, partial [Promethearchaeota archaeon]
RGILDDKGIPVPLKDLEILEIAKAENRIIITKDEMFSKMAPDRIIFAKGTKPVDYLTTLKSKIDIKLNFDQACSRCHKCNEVLIEVPKNSVRNKVKDKTFQHHDTFYECPKCGKVYWQGAHFTKEKNGILTRFQGLID